MFGEDGMSFWVDGFGLGSPNALVRDGESWFPGNGAADGELYINVNTASEEPFVTFVLKETPTLIPERSDRWPWARCCCLSFDDAVRKTRDKLKSERGSSLAASPLLSSLRPDIPRRDRGHVCISEAFSRHVLVVRPDRLY